MIAHLRHYFGTAIFLGVAILNHKLGLELTWEELVILSAVLGLSQITSLIRTIRADKAALDVGATPPEAS